MEKERDSGPGKAKRDYPVHVPITSTDEEATWTYLYWKETYNAVKNGIESVINHFLGKGFPMLVRDSWV